MVEVLVLVDHVDGAVSKATLELLTIARRFGEASAVFLGTGAESAVEILGRYGASKIYLVDAPELGACLVVSKAEALAQIATHARPGLVLLTSSREGKEIAARLAIKLESGLITDALDVTPGEGGTPVATTSAFAAAYVVTSTVTRGTPIITLKPGAAIPEPAETTAEPITFDACFTDSAPIARITRRTPHAVGRPPLAKAPIVVSGGRGVGGPGNWALIERLADALGAAVGASKPPVQTGWCPPANKVGQTGTVVSPELYVAIGISGAIHHQAGMQASRTIVAINRDPQAPIFEIADFGVVGDLRTLVPQLIEEIERHRSQWTS